MDPSGRATLYLFVAGFRPLWELLILTVARPDDYSTLTLSIVDSVVLRLHFAWSRWSAEFLRFEAADISAIECAFAEF